MEEREAAVSEWRREQSVSLLGSAQCPSEICGYV